MAVFGYCIYVGGRSDIHAIASLTCMVLRKGLPPIRLPLSILDNPISFSLPERSKQNPRQKKEIRSLSDSSSTQTTELSSQLGPKESMWEVQVDVKEGVHHDTGVSMSMASTSLVPFLAFRDQEDPGRSLLVRDFDSDNNNNASNHCSDAGDLHASIHVFGTSCSSSRGASNVETTLPSDDVDNRLRTDLEQFADYFPELDETKRCCFRSHISDSSSNPTKWAELKQVSSNVCDSDSIEVVAVPTATECSGSSAEDPRDSPIAISLKKSTTKSAIKFVEEPLPQVLHTHQPPSHFEPVYLKLNSVNR